MIVTIRPSTITGAIQAPPSKSSSQRALAAALIRKGRSEIQNIGKSQDELAAIELIRNLGASLAIKGDVVNIESNGVDPTTNELNCGESGLALRMFTPIAALSNKEIRISGEGSLTRRPVNFFDSFFPELGVETRSNDGKLPVRLKGPLQPRTVHVDGSLSSQFITGLIMAYSAANAGNVSIKVNNLKSKPYVDLTLDIMQKFGLPVPENKNYEEFIFHQHSSPTSLPDNRLETIYYSVESDWSSAAFLLVGGCIAGPLTITGLDLSSKQADKAIIDLLMRANAGIAVEAKGIKVRPAEMRSFEFDATDAPDLFPPLVALAAFCNGTSTIKGVSRLIHKESNRALSLHTEFSKMGVQTAIDGDCMYVNGTNSVKGAKVRSHHDHRIAMACTITALRADGNTVIENAEAVNKSYPGFFYDLKKLGANVSLEGE